MTAQAPLPFFTAWTSVARSIAVSVRLLAAGCTCRVRTLRSGCASTTGQPRASRINRSPAVLVPGRLPAESRDSW
jgi:hypothetical protein